MTPFTVWDWFKRYGWLVVLAVLALLALIFIPRARSGSVFVDVLKEYRAIDAERDAAVRTAEEGHAAAVEAIEARYADEVADIERTAADRLTELRKDPRQLARELALHGRPLPQ